MKKITGRGIHRLHNVGPKFIKTHGMTGTSTYRIWLQMMNRCKPNTAIKNMKYYSGRGINVCERWQIFENFLEDMGIRPIGLSLDRINNDLGYSKENCRWATHSEQSRNMSSNLVFEKDGRKQCLMDWSTELNINYKSLRYRISFGWPFELAISMPFTGHRLKKLDK